ncbi:MAG: FAD-dependent oxidoreductase [Planctomycetota bacterium]|nr:FAD-dependent oxidoreductase [Planctomycetota bacterium]
MNVDPRFLTEQGPEIFSGNELVLKGALEVEGGVHLLGGYPGSPIAGFFDHMTFIKDLLNAKGIRAVINHNEALAAAMLNGTQSLPCRAIIAMKSVGVHVAADALALGSLAGANPQGGAMIVYGEDPWSDSTQVPADSRFISKHLYIPVLEPANPQEVKDYVDLAMKFSRRSELYAGYILPTNLADGGGSVQCRPNQYPKFNILNPVELETRTIDLNKRVLLPPKTWWQEASYPERFQRGIRVSRDLGLNRIEYPQTTRKPIGFVTSGMAHGYLVQTLLELGLLGESPILKYGLTYPIDPDLVRELARQCERIIVVEERRAFLEPQVCEVVQKDIQAGLPEGRVEVWGKKFPDSLPGLPEIRGLHPSIIAERLIPLFKKVQGPASRLAMPSGAPTASLLDEEIRTIDATAQADMKSLPPRLATFCPGCPHRDTSSVCLEIRKRFQDERYMRRVHKCEPVDMVFHGDIGCYTMLMYPPNTELMHNLSGMGLGGGTGTGIDPFITNKQAVFMGDSTFYHCGVLGISQAIKLGQDITFLILDNATTAMTGHQTTPGLEWDVLGHPTAVQDIEEILRGMAATNDMTIVRVDPEKRDEYIELLERTFLADGVKVVIADKECGITRGRRKRRAEAGVRKRLGFLPAWQHMNVNTEICRFCLACTELTGCAGLKHVETDYGRKIDTDITWCVDDGACQRVGACSSFERVTVLRRRVPRSRVPELKLDEIPEPVRRPHGDLWRACLAGVGTQGIGTATSILVRAGHKEGYNVIFLDKKGLAIRGGGVVSQLVYNITNQPITPVVPYGKADLLLGVDVLEAARAIDPGGRMRVASKDRTAAVINTDKFATIRGTMGQEDFNVDELERAIRTHTRADDYLAKNIARLCEVYLGSKIYTNIMMLGFAFQKGLIPVSMHSMAWALKDTIRSEFRKNLYAFNMGRKLVEDRDLFLGPPHRKEWRDTLEDKWRWTMRRYRAGTALADALRTLAAETVDKCKDLDEKSKRDFVIRVYDCMRWGGIEYARQYADAVASVYARDAAALGRRATRAVIVNLAQAMLIKDGVFLAELATSPEKYQHDREKYNVNPANGDRIVYRHLWTGTLNVWPWPRKKYRLSLSCRPLRLLKRMRWLRKVLPGWHAGAHRHLEQYRRLVTEFRYANEGDYHRQVALLSGSLCMDCLAPRCQEAGCPLESRAPQWMRLAGQQRWREACEAIHAANNFPEFTAALCPAPCQKACKQGINTFPVQIRHIEGQIVERGFAHRWIVPQPSLRKTGKKVAVVGSGPAGLAAAQQLARAGHDVTVLEKADAPGGLLRYGVPDFRLQKTLLDRRIEQLKAEGVVFRVNAHVGTELPADALRKDFDALLVAVGSTTPRDLNVPGRSSAGVHFALDFLRQENLRRAGAAVPDDQAIWAAGKKVVVIGGGETGNDRVETALAQGAASVCQIEVLDAADVAADQTHVRPANVRRLFRTATRRFCQEDGRLVGLAAGQVRWVVTTDGSRMVDVPDSEQTIEADLALLAVGFQPGLDETLIRQLGLRIDPAGKVVAANAATNVSGVFIAGDATTGPALIASAIASGRKAAERIDQFLQS